MCLFYFITIDPCRMFPRPVSFWRCNVVDMSPHRPITTPSHLAARCTAPDVQMDILQATLAAGIRVNKYVPSYGDQPNDVQHVTKCASCDLSHPTTTDGGSRRLPRQVPGISQAAVTTSTFVLLARNVRRREWSLSIRCEVDCIG